MTRLSKVILAHVVFLVAMVAVVWAGTAWAGDVEEVTAYRVHGRTFDTLEEAQEHEAYTEAREFVVRATRYSEPTEARFIYQGATGGRLMKKEDIEIEQKGKEATVSYKGIVYDFTIGESSYRDKDGNSMPFSIIRDILAKLEKLRIERVE